MKNSNNNSATVKSQVQSAAVIAVKAIVYPAHLVCQTTADLLSIGQAQVISKIDGTPVIQSVMECQSWTQEQQSKVVGKAMAIQERWERQRESNRQQDIDRLKAKLDQKEGVEHMPTTEPTPVVASVKTEPTPVAPDNVVSFTPTLEELELILNTNPLTDKEEKIITKVTEAIQPVVIVPAPPVTKVSKPRASKKHNAPLMTAPAV